MRPALCVPWCVVALVCSGLRASGQGSPAVPPPLAPGIQVGQRAPELALLPFDTIDEEDRVRLADRRARHVVLCFGSYTCPCIRKEAPAIRHLYARFHDSVAMYFVYIREGHPIDGPNGRERGENARFGAREPQTFLERAALASLCAKRLELEMPVLVDEMSNLAQTAYSAWPSRLFVVGPDGRVCYRAPPGPEAFHPSEVEAALVARGIRPVEPKPSEAPGSGSR